MNRGVGTGLLLLGGSIALAACSGGVNAAGPPVPPGPEDRVSGNLSVLADPSYRDVFDQIAAAVERDHPRAKVRVRYGSPAEVTDGVDLVASSSRQAMDRLRGQGVVGDASVVAQQTPALVVAPRNPAHVGVLADLRRSGVPVALCSSATSCGEATTDLLERAGVTPSEVRRVPDSGAGLRSVTDSAVDAAVIWASDIRGRSGQGAFAHGVREVPMAAPAQQDIRLRGFGSRPVLVALAPHGNQQAAEAFVDDLRGGLGQQLLSADGFR